MIILLAIFFGLMILFLGYANWFYWREYQKMTPEQRRHPDNGIWLCSNPLFISRILAAIRDTNAYFAHRLKFAASYKIYRALS